MARKLETDRSDGGGRVISKDVLQKLMGRSLSAKKTVDAANEAVATALSNAVTEHGLHKGAFGWCKKLTGLGLDDPVKLRAFLDAFDLYRDLLEIDAKAAGDMFKDRAGEKADGEDESTAEAGGKRVKSNGKTDVKDAKSGTPMPRSEFQRALKDNIKEGDKVAELARKAGAETPTPKPH